MTEIVIKSKFNSGEEISIELIQDRFEVDYDSAATAFYRFISSSDGFLLKNKIGIGKVA